MTPDSDKLWEEIAELTLAKCRTTCHKLGSCCSSEYCEMAAEIMTRAGEPVPQMINGSFIQNGHCVIHPRFRPLCSLHQCKINGLGCDPKDPEWTRKYFELREKLEEQMAQANLM